MDQGRWGSNDPNMITYFLTLARRQTVRYRIGQSWNPRPAASLKSPSQSKALPENWKSIPIALLSRIPQTRDCII
ncbi:hypothetical protein C1H46_033009 [Malus baccata]|uniref:Uncharacterized protein n=1 Tax=Malus baccata TaxID=106549 RepID=A0A540L4M1_MALBA|nr:hypothetical protein C1H46_033009 [Malus baccata]